MGWAASKAVVPAKHTISFAPRTGPYPMDGCGWRAMCLMGRVAGEAMLCCPKGKVDQSVPGGIEKVVPGSYVARGESIFEKNSVVVRMRLSLRIHLHTGHTRPWESFP